VDPYQLLGVEPSWTLDEIESRYRELMMRYHPDLHLHEGPEAVRTAEQRTAVLNEAVRRLRAEHPAQGHAAGPASSTQTAGRHRGAGAAGSSPGATGATKTAWFAEPDTSTWTTGPNGEDFGITYGWPPPPAEAKPRREQPCPFCGAPFDDIVAFEAHLASKHGWDYRNARPRRARHSRRRRRKRSVVHRGPKYSAAERYLEWTATFVALTVISSLVVWRTRLRYPGITLFDPFLFMIIAALAALVFRLLFWRSK
jgi:curved DNA-binding protein CbpA